MDSQATKIEFSKIESDIIGLKIGRCNESFFNENELLNEILNGQFDICRLKIASEDELASIKLQKIGFPFYFSGSIRRYKTRISEYPEGEFLHPTLTFEMYDGTQDDLLLEMLKGTWGDYPLGYYRTPYLHEIIDKENEISSVFQFYKKNNLNATNPKNSILFMNDQGRYVGFFALNIINGNLESHIGGILPPYQKCGYFLDMLRYIKVFCIDNQLPYFLFGARNENALVQKIFQDVGFIAIGTENVFHIIPFLTHGSIVISKEIYEYQLTSNFIYNEMISFLKDGDCLDYKFKIFTELNSPKRFQLQVSEINFASSENMLICKIMSNNEILGYAFGRFFKRTL